MSLVMSLPKNQGDVTGDWAQERLSARALGSVQVTAQVTIQEIQKCFHTLNSVGILLLGQSNLTGNVTGGRREA